MSVAPGRPRAVLFDWDNTLVDNWGAIRDALNETFVAMGKPPWTLDETRGRVRHSMRDSFPRMFGARWEEARDVFYAAFAARHLEGLAVLPGAEEMLESLHGSGLYLGVVSNKNGEMLRRESAHLGWDRFFGAVVGAGDAVADKPDAAPVRAALGTSGIGCGGAVWVVGDTWVDMACAIAAGCTPVLYAPGQGTEEEFRDHPPAFRIGALSDLTSLVVDAPANQL